MSTRVESCQKLFRIGWRTIDPKLGFPYLSSYFVPAVCSSVGLVSPSLLYDVGFPLSFSALYLYDLGTCWTQGNVYLPGAVFALLMFGNSIRQLSLTFYRQKSQQYLDNLAKFFPEEKSSFFSLIFNWQHVSLICFIGNALPFLFISRAEKFDWLSISGISLIAISAIVQAAADYCKISHKKKYGDTFCDTGLYSLCRHPNYLAQVTLTLGLIVTCSSAVRCFPRLIFLALPHLLFMFQMFSVTKMMAKMQARKYQNNSDYARYSDRVKKMIPYIW